METSLVRLSHIYLQRSCAYFVCFCTSPSGQQELEWIPQWELPRLTTITQGGIGHFHMTSAVWAGGNNKSVGIVQTGNWLLEHKHTSWITQNQYTLVHSGCIISCGIAQQTNCQAGWLHPWRTLLYYLPFSTLGWFTFRSWVKTPYRGWDLCSISVVSGYRNKLETATVYHEECIT